MLALLYSCVYYVSLGSLLCYALSFFFEAFANVIYKEKLFLKGLTHLLFSTDKKWKRPSDPASVAKLRSKQVVFVRHGESAWNVVFNRGFGPTFPGRALSACFDELRVLPTLDSVFADSPLSVLGCRQALELQSFVETHPLLRGSEGKSVLVSSNLRRAVSTGVIGFLPRLKRSQEKIHILSSLQEVTFNIDGVSLAKPHTPPVLSDDEMHALSVKRGDFNADRYMDATESFGDKAVRGKGLTRMQDFCKWVFARDEPTVIAAGHSLYFRYFFHTFLPWASAFVGRESKMGNGAVVSFTLWEGEGGYVIDEASITVLHGHFEQASAKKKK